MVPSEILNDIIEDPTSEWVDDTYFEDDDLEEELDLTTRSHSNRPETNKSTGSQIRESSKRIRSKRPRPAVFDLNNNKLKRDPTVESIIESRKSTVIENAYTRLAQTTSQTLRSSQNARVKSLKQQSIPAKTENEVHLNGKKDQIINSQNDKKISLTPIFQFDNEKWDDGLNGDFDKESIPSKDKSCSQLYEDTCKRLNICPSSVIIRSLYTTKINLENYGLGPRGSAALTVALVRNRTVISLNLSGNNIGNIGMSHIYQILTENPYIEEYDLSYNNLGTKGIRKLATAAVSCVQLKTLSVAGNELTANDINILLSKLEDHSSLNDLNISHNQLDEEGGIYIAKWLSDNNVLLNLNVSWCSIRLMGARAIAKSIGDNNKLISLDLSYNSFTNDQVEILTNSLTRNMILKELNLSGNQIICQYDIRIKGDPSILIIGKEALIYKMFVAAATNQALKIFRLGKNHLDTRSVMIMLEALSKLDNISLEELDLTGITLNLKQISDIHKFFVNHPKFTCYVGPIKQTIEHFANILLNSIHTYCQENHVQLIDIFSSNEENNVSKSMITYDEFRNGLRKAKIPFQVAQFENVIKYLGRDNEKETISLRSLEIA